MPFPIAAAIGVGSALSSLFGGGGSKTETTTKEPWGPQGDQLRNAFGEARSIYDAQRGTPWYSGDLYARLDPTTGRAIDNVEGYVNGRGAALSDALGTSAMGGLGQQGNYYGAIDRYSRMSGEDPTGANIRSASAYADNPFVTGQIDAASRDVARNLHENQLPSIDRAATGSGNINSTRAGVASGIAQRGAADRIGDIASSIRGDAYNRGLSLAEQARSTNLGAAGNAAGLYGQAFGQGINAAGAANDMALGNQDAAIRAGQIRQQDQQGQLDADFRRWQGNDTRQNDLLQRYYSIIGSNDWGGTSTTTSRQPSNPIGTGLGVFSTLKGLGVH